MPVSKKKLWFLLFASLLLLIIGYYTVEVVIARMHTATIASALLSEATIQKDDLTSRQLDILIKVQDPNFYFHKGVEFRTAGTGWTGITQSLAKTFYFRNFNQGIAKVKQTLCARFALDPLVPKDDQITIFINSIYFGNGQYGLDNAAQYYFSKEVGELAEDEYISLIASLISPTSLNIKDNPTENLQRVNRIKKMLSGAYIPKNLLDIEYSGALDVDELY